MFAPLFACLITAALQSAIKKAKPAAAAEKAPASESDNGGPAEESDLVLCECECPYFECEFHLIPALKRNVRNCSMNACCVDCGKEWSDIRIRVENFAR